MMNIISVQWNKADIIQIINSSKKNVMIAFGPIPSRRLGQSLGVNNIPPKICSYDCIYCQVGPTSRSAVERQAFFEVEKVVAEVTQKVAEKRAAHKRIDYITFVPDGEPTLDIHLGEMIDGLKPLGVKIGVITNGTLLWREDVQEELCKADLVSVKVDSAEEKSWKKINRPDAALSHAQMLEGQLAFSKKFKGRLITETMLVKGANDKVASLEATARFLKKLNPHTAYIAVPTRPPSESWAGTPDEQRINRAYQIFLNQLDRVECLLGFSPQSFEVTGDVVQSIMDITAVHPMRESEVLKALKKGGLGSSTLEELITKEKLVKIEHEGQPFYMRKLKLV
jgi:wyosine [tRNA(Phe)-imidazoG37] synthetase (radical SAM superfamily)